MSESNFGARWWRESLVTARLARGGLASTLGLVGGAALLLPGCVDYGVTRMDEVPTEAQGDQLGVSVDALQLQKQQGWNVGDVDAPLVFPDSSVTDVAGGESWRTAMEPLAQTLQPAAPALQPYYVPTLFQSLIGPAGQRLRAVMRPIHSPAMDHDFARGLALRTAFGAAGWPRDTALIVDAPGPRAVAVAAGLADRFAPVFTFGNWPHPLGVVPAHQTLAATLFYLPAFAAAQAARPADAPPMFVLDANRLLPYGDADAQFDNRYFVQLPDAAALQALGIRHLLYVSADGRRELDDLNQSLVALFDRGVDVQLVALSDFVPAGTVAPWMVESNQPYVTDDGDDDAALEPMVEFGLPLGAFFDPWPFWFGVGYWGHPHYCYGGFARGGVARFWRDFGPGRHLPGRPVAGLPGRFSGGRPRWAPSPRPTLFNPRAGRPMASFGRVPVWASRQTGHVTAVGFGHGLARSGSIGRAGGGFGG